MKHYIYLTQEQGKGGGQGKEKHTKKKTESAPNGGENNKLKTDLLCRGLTMKFRQQKTLQKGGCKGYKILFYTDLSNNKEQKTPIHP